MAATKKNISAQSNAHESESSEPWEKEQLVFQHKLKPKQKMMLKGLANLLPIGMACKKAGIGRTTHYEWLKNDPEYKAAYDELRDWSIEECELALDRAAIYDRDIKAIMFKLERICPEKYGRRHEITGLNGAPIQIDDARSAIAQKLTALAEPDDAGEITGEPD